MMEIHNTFIGADGNDGITVYKSIDKKVINEVKLMYFFKYNSTQFETNYIYSYGCEKNKYKIEKIKNYFYVKKTNPKGKVFEYKLFCHYDKKSGDLFIDKKSKMKNGKVKMKMYGNYFHIMRNISPTKVLFEKVS